MSQGVKFHYKSDIGDFCLNFEFLKSSFNSLEQVFTPLKHVPGAYSCTLAALARSYLNQFSTCFTALPLLLAIVIKIILNCLETVRKHDSGMECLVSDNLSPKCVHTFMV